MKLVYICSPYRGDEERNTVKAQGYCLFATTQGGVPFAPHLHNTQFLDDCIPEQRALGLHLGLAILKEMDELWVFGTRISEGMVGEIEAAEQLGILVVYFTDKCQRRSL